MWLLICSPENDMYCIDELFMFMSLKGFRRKASRLHVILNMNLNPVFFCDIISCHEQAKSSTTV